MKRTAEQHARIVRKAIDNAQKKRGDGLYDSKETTKELKQLSGVIFKNIIEAGEYISIMEKSAAAIRDHLSYAQDASVFSDTKATYS